MTNTPTPLHERHEATQEALKWFDCEHLPDDLQAITRPLRYVAHHVASQLPDSPNLTKGLNRLLDAKDVLVRAKINARPTQTPEEPEK